MIIYKITNIVNGKIYIGQTKNSLKKRWNQHISKSSNCRVISKAIQKYGVENFTIDQIDSASSKEELNQKEIYWIKQLNAISPNGYNRTFGGTTRNIEYIVSEETRKKLSEIRKGKRLSKETKQKISEVRKKTKLPDEILKRLSENGKKYRHSEEVRKKMSENKLKNSIYSKPIIAIDKQNQQFKFKDVNEAAYMLNLQKYSITRVLKGERETIKGFKFKYNGDTQ